VAPSIGGVLALNCAQFDRELMNLDFYVRKRAVQCVASCFELETSSDLPGLLTPEGRLPNPRGVPSASRVRRFGAGLRGYGSGPGEPPWSVP
jgi:hypothetical protein